MHGVKGRLVALGGSHGKSVMGFPRFVGAKSLPGYSLKKPSKLGLRNVGFLFRPADVAKTCRKNAIMFRTCERNLSTTLPSVASVGQQLAPINTRPVGYWLLGCAGIVAGMVAVGGITRITRSGLSMVTWKPHGGLPPMNLAEWQAEFEMYKQFPEFQQRQNMTLDEFKHIFWWEYGHRMLGRVLGLAFTLPLGYFVWRGKIPREYYGRFATLFGLGAAQGGIGWWMVKSGLQDEERNGREVRVSPYRLATHLGFAFTSYSLLMWTAFEMLSSKAKLPLIREALDPLVLSKAAKIRRVAHATAGVLGLTVLSGAFVAGIDAGMAYNTFPKMGDQWIPDEILTMKPLYKNFFENTALVQLDHRLLALTTLSGVTTMYAWARHPHVWGQLPKMTKTALQTTMALAGAQVVLGISTLLLHVPTPLAVAHQSGSVVLLTSVLWTLHSLRFAKLPKASVASATAGAAASVVANAPKNMMKTIV